MEITKHPFPAVVPGAAVCLKRFEEPHAQVMFDCIQRDRERLLRFLPWPRNINTVEDELAFIKESRPRFDDFSAIGYGIFLRSDHSFAGTIGSFNIDCENRSFEIGYWLLGSCEGHGYMTEALELLVREHASRGFHRAVLLCEPDNARSRAVALRCGFEYEGTLHDCKWNGTAFLDMQVYARILDGVPG